MRRIEGSGSPSSEGFLVRWAEELAVLFDAEIKLVGLVLGEEYLGLGCCALEGDYAPCFGDGEFDERLCLRMPDVAIREWVSFF